MAIFFGSGIDLVKSELRNARLHNLATAPASPGPGQMYFDTVTGKFNIYNGATWDAMGTSTASGDVSHAAAVSVDSELVLFSGVGGKTIKRATLTGIVKSTAGVASVASPGTDYTTPGSTETFTNKTFNANGTGNALSNVEVADLAAGVLNTSGTLAGAADTQVPSALAVKTYADALLNANDAMVFKGAIDCSTNPNYPAADAGHTYKVSVAGKIGGASGIDVTVGDTLYCTVDATAAGTQAGVGANWIIVQANVDRATDATLGLAEYATAAEAEAKSLTTVAVTPAALANFPQKKIFTIGDAAATSFALTHNLNTQNVVVTVREASTNDLWLVDVKANTVNQVTVGPFVTAPTASQFVVTVIA